MAFGKFGKWTPAHKRIVECIEQCSTLYFDVQGDMLPDDKEVLRAMERVEKEALLQRLKDEPRVQIIVPTRLAALPGDSDDEADDNTVDDGDKAPAAPLLSQYQVAVYTVNKATSEDMVYLELVGPLYDDKGALPSAFNPALEGDKSIRLPWPTAPLLCPRPHSIFAQEIEELLAGGRPLAAQGNPPPPGTSSEGPPAFLGASGFDLDGRPVPSLSGRAQDRAFAQAFVRRAADDPVTALLFSDAAGPTVDAGRIRATLSALGSRVLTMAADDPLRACVAFTKMRGYPAVEDLDKFHCFLRGEWDGAAPLRLGLADFADPLPAPANPKDALWPLTRRKCSGAQLDHFCRCLKGLEKLLRAVLSEKYKGSLAPLVARLADDVTAAHLTNFDERFVYDAFMEKIIAVFTAMRTSYDPTGNLRGPALWAERLQAAIKDAIVCPLPSMSDNNRSTLLQQQFLQRVDDIEWGPPAHKRAGGGVDGAPRGKKGRTDRGPTGSSSSSSVPPSTPASTAPTAAAAGVAAVTPAGDPAAGVGHTNNAGNGPRPALPGAVPRLCGFHAAYLVGKASPCTKGASCTHQHPDDAPVDDIVRAIERYFTRNLPYRDECIAAAKTRAGTA